MSSLRSNALRLTFLLPLAAVLLAASPVRSAETVVISEFLADNVGGLLDEDLDSSDWIEIYNSGTAAVDLLGWHLTDETNNLAKWTFPTTIIEPKGFLIVFASSKDRVVSGAPLHANFSLDPGGEYLALVHPDGVTIATEFKPAYPNQRANFSYGLGQSLTISPLAGNAAPIKALVPPDGSLGVSWTAEIFNDSGWINGTNGVGYETSIPGFAVRNFKANITVDTLAKAEGVITNAAQQTSVALTNSPVINFTDSQGDGHYSTGNLAFPGQTIAQNLEDFVLEIIGTITIPSAGAWTFGVNSDDGFRLVIGTNAPIFFDIPRGPSDTLGTITFPAAGDYPLRLLYYERGGGAEAELFAAQGTLATWGATFRLVGDVANGGLAIRSLPVQGGTTLGYRNSIRTDIQSQMLSNNATAYIRVPFSVGNAAGLTSLYLQMKYDDGFVAYLNGTEVARRNAPASPQWNSTATGTHLGTTLETINLTGQLGLLHDGPNLLAIHGLNLSANDSDFLILAELNEFQVLPNTNQFFTTPTPGAYNTGSTFGGFVADTKFSHDRGFYETNFACTISTATEGATIKYTLNGSWPSTTNGLVYSGPIPITNTTVLRVVALKDGLLPSDVDTATYIFVNDVVIQSRLGQAPGPGWPTVSSTAGQIYDYGMDPEIVTNAVWGATIRDDLKSIPSFSIVMDLKDLFDNATGIYANPRSDERAWERPGSLELIHPDGDDGFQINCGVRIRGGFSRDPANPKHAFRFFFRQEYGAAKLSYPVFGGDGAESFDKFDLRTMQNYSWSYQNDARMIGLRDQFSRDAQLAMGRPAERGDFFHLYVNGQYWGLYNTDERAEASHGESYLGGRAEDYDTVKVDPDLGYIVEPTDGTLDAWEQLWRDATNGFAADADYFRVQGLNVDGTPNPAYPNLLDVPNLIDYMLIIIFGGNLDAPISNFLANDAPNNWFGIRHRGGLSGGFKFFAHDSEHTLRNDGGELNRDRVGLANNATGAIDPDWTSGNPLTQLVGTTYTPTAAFSKSSPQYLWFRLWANPEFRLRVADHVQKHFFNGGVFTTQGARSMFMSRSNEIYRAIVCESARWGDAKRAVPFTRNDWLNEMRIIGGTYLNQRPAIVLNQLRARALFPNVVAPIFNQRGGLVTNGFLLYITNANPGTTTLYYTLDGTDPRQRGGAPASSALVYTPGTGIPLTQQTTVRARVLSNTVWSAITEATFFPAQDFSKLLITEIMYNPPFHSGLPGDLFEFLEFKNAGSTDIELGGFRFTDGITFTFTNGTRLAPGQFFVIGRDTRLINKYPGLTLNGLYTGRLDNAGETLTLKHPLGFTVFSFAYNNGGQWPITPDGQGFSLVPRNPNSNPDPGNPRYWRSSSARGGSPGADDPEYPVQNTVLITEILAHTLPPAEDQIEVFNPHPFPVDLSGSFLTDDSRIPNKYRIPGGTLAPGAYRVFSETDFNDTNAPTYQTPFALDSGGEEVYFASGNPSLIVADLGFDQPTGYSHGFSFDASPEGVTIGRHVISTGDDHFVLMATPSLGGPNSAPLVGPVVIRQVMYHPPDMPGAVDNQADEYIELVNTSAQPVPFYDPLAPTNTWHLRGGVDFDFPTGFTLGPGSNVVLVSFPNGNPNLLAAFRGKFGLFANAPIFGPFTGKLDNSSDAVEIKRPDVATTNGAAYIPVDRLDYRHDTPWPIEADGAGAALVRVNLATYGNDPANWSTRVPLNISSQPVDVITSPTSNLTFTVVANGSGILTYQWLFNGASIANNATYFGANTSTLSISNAQPSQVGDYTVQISDVTGAILSRPASLVVKVRPLILINPQPASQVVLPNDLITLTVVITNTASLPITYEWRQGSLGLGTNVAYSLTNSFTFRERNTNSFVITNRYRVVAKNIATVSGEASGFATNIVLPDVDGDRLPDNWEAQYGFNTNTVNNAADDPDGDRMSNLDEYTAGTDPTNGLSYLKIDSIAGGSDLVTVQFSGVSNKSYTLQGALNLQGTSWSNLVDIPTQIASGTVIVTNAAPGAVRRFYRLVTPQAQ